MNRILAMACFLSTTVFGATVTLDAGTKLYTIENRKVVVAESVEETTQVNVRKQVGKGKWLQIEHDGKLRYVPTKMTRAGTSRKPSSASSTASYNRRGGTPMKGGADVLYGPDLGIGLGARFGAEFPVFKDPIHIFEAQGLLAYFPSGGAAGVSASSFIIGGQAKYGYRVTEDIRVGPEAGLAFISTSATVTTEIPGFESVSASGSTFTFSLGAYAEGVVTKEWGWNGGMRFLFSSGSALLFYAGAQYYF